MPAINTDSGAPLSEFPNTGELVGDDLLSAVSGEIEIDFEIRSGMLVFVMKQTGGIRQLVDRDDVRGAYIGVPEKENAVIEINLSRWWNWEFLPKAFTPKKPEHYEYYHFKFDAARPRQIVLHIKTTNMEPDDLHSERDCQPFNFCILMAQPGASRKLPVIIDPDVKNPPPRGGPLTEQRWGLILKRA